MTQQRSSSTAKRISIIAGVGILVILLTSLYTLRDEALDKLLSQHRLVADPYSIIRSPRPYEPVSKDRTYPPPKSKWDPTKKYLTYLPFGGISNQFYSFQNAATIAKRLNRTLVMPPITSNRHDRLSTNQPWSHYMDLDHLRQQAQLDLVEWHEIKHIDPESLDIVRQGNRLAIPSGWRALSERFPCQVVRGYGRDYWNNPNDDSIGADFAYQYLLALEAIPVPGTDRNEVTSFVDDIVQGNRASNDTVVCLSFTFTAQFERGRNRWDIGWNLIGQHVRFLPRFAAYVEDLIAFRFSEWDRYQPLTETQVYGEDPALLESPSMEIKQLLEGVSEHQDDMEQGGNRDHPAPQATTPNDSVASDASSVLNKDHVAHRAPVASARILQSGHKVGHAAQHQSDNDDKGSKEKGTKRARTSAPSSKRQDAPPSSEGEQGDRMHPQAPRGLGRLPLDHGPEAELVLSNKMAPREYIAIHLRRGDIDTKCASNKIKDCVIPLSEYQKHVNKIIAEHAREKGSGTAGAAEPAPRVVLVSDTDNEAEKQEIDRYGWYRLDYRTDEFLVDAWNVLGPFSPAFIDSSVLTGRSARWVIGSRRSTMSWLAAMRLSSWFNRTIIYPALPPELLKQQQEEMERLQLPQLGTNGGTGRGGGTKTSLVTRSWDDDEIVVLDRREQAYFDHLYLPN